MWRQTHDQALKNGYGELRGVSLDGYLEEMTVDLSLEGSFFSLL